TTPLLTFLLAVAVGQERFRLANLAGALVALSGIVLVFRERVGTDVPAGSLLAIFGGALCAATAGIVVKRFPRSHPLSANLVGMSVGAFLLLSLSLVFGEPAALPSRPETIVAVLWLVASSVTAFVLMIWILARWTASATAYGAVLSPIVTILLANALEGEGFPPILLAGGALVLVGVYLGAVRGASTGGPAVSASSPARAR
ncbi:MAG: DMT family transporter, partial [Methanobacteriota archaeon]